MKGIVHGLLDDLAVCRFRGCVPRDWPEGHSWHRIEEPEQINCQKCLNELLRRAAQPEHLAGIARKVAPGANMGLINEAEITVEHGLEGDCRGRGGWGRKRQITVLSVEQWDEACEALGELGEGLSWFTRRANFLVVGLRFGPETLGKKLRIGANVILEITGETKPCNRMDEDCPGLKAALAKDWRGGVTCRVIQRGRVRKYDALRCM